ncbi:MAG: glutamine--fructose-6-phosphate transaminase (isomerizing) [Chloroflexota bacterium]
MSQAEPACERGGANLRKEWTMCGVFGYIGEPTDLAADLLRGLQTLEYRGYDSWGIALAAGDLIDVTKQTGRIAGATHEAAPTDMGFGHTRWATHGGVTEPNAHPHLDCTGRVAVIHNGIIENHRALRQDLTERGHVFTSETDSEVVAHLIEDRLAAGDALAEALSSVFSLLQGYNAIVVMDAATREMAATKRVSPLVAGAGPTGCYIASDALALRPHVDGVIYLEDHQLLRMSRQGISLFERETLAPIPADTVALHLDAVDASLGQYPHFMAKEMDEQPGVIRRMVAGGMTQIEALAAEMRAASQIVLLGCGTAANAAMTGRYLLSRVAGAPSQVVAGSEFPLVEPFIGPGTLVVALSQSGETVDVIEGMLAARARGARLAALVNVPNSTLDRMVDLRVHLGAGAEQCVLATKSYTAKVTALLLAAHAMAGTPGRGAELAERAADGLEAMLREDAVDRVREVAHRIVAAPSLFVIGRGLSYPSALEAALKIKEVSYIHAEGFAAGELKHGVIALVEPGTPCIVYAPPDETRADVLSGAMELRSRGGYIIGVGGDPDPAFDVSIPAPDVAEAFPIVAALPAQLLGYHTALLRGNDPDRPRNLAKSVTVK